MKSVRSCGCDNLQVLVMPVLSAGVGKNFIRIKSAALCNFKPHLFLEYSSGDVKLKYLHVSKLGKTGKVEDGLQVDAMNRLGADHVNLAGASFQLRKIRAATQKRIVDVSFEAAGVQETVDDAIAAIHPGGKLIVAGISGDDKTSFASSVAMRMKHTYWNVQSLRRPGVLQVELADSIFGDEHESKRYQKIN